MISLIVNPVAGAGRGRRVGEEMLALLKSKGLEAGELVTEGPGHATELARRAALAGAETVVSVGGDGTTLEVAQGLQGTGAALGIIPAGTGNDFIKSTGIPARPEEALEHLLTHPPRPVDMGTINGRAFMNVCGTGFDVMVLDNANRYKKHLHGLLPYLLGLLRAIFNYRPVHVRLTLDDGESVERDVLICAAANGVWFGGGIPICPEARPDDGLMDVVIVDNVPRHVIPRYLPALLNKKVLELPITRHVRCRKVLIESEGMRVQVDGEITPMDRAEIALHPGALQLHW